MDENKIKELSEKFDNIENIHEKNRFYFKEILPLYVNDFINNSKSNLKSKILFTSLGTSPQTSVLITKLLNKLDRVYAIVTEKTSNNIDFIKEYGNFSCKDKQIIQLLIDSEDTIGTYKTIYEQLKKLILKDKIHSSLILFDITGGKKNMSAVMNFIAGLYNIPTIYIDSVYNSQKRRPEFGTERAIIIENPIYYTGEKYVYDAIKSFNEYSFSFAHDLLTRQLEKNKIDRAKEANFIKELSEIYNDWFQFKLDDAGIKLFNLLNNYTAETSRFQINEKLQVNLETINKARNDAVYKILNLYFLARKNYELKKYDFGVLLLYRTQEAILNEGIKTFFKEFNSSKPNWNKLDITFEQFKKVADLVYEKEGGYKGTNLPYDCGLLDCAIILYIKKSEIVKNIEKIKKIKDRAYLRNLSYLEHGYQVLRKENFEELNEITLDLLKSFLKEKNITEDVEIILDKEFSFPKLNEGLL